MRMRIGEYGNRHRATLPYPVYVTNSKHWSLGVRDPVSQKNARSTAIYSTCHGLFSMRKARNYRQAYWWPKCGAFARSTGLPCRRKVERGEDGRPKTRCWNHGGAPGSGKQTEQGRRNIGEASRQRMIAFWRDWKAKGSPPIVRGHTVGQPKRAQAAVSERPGLSPESDEQRRARVIADLKRRYPDRDWS
jgi:hypothetical protein